MNIAFDSHKRYTLSSVADDCGRVLEEVRIDHQRGAIVDYLCRFPKGESVAVETIGNWYWIVDEIEASGLRPLLVHARRAKAMMCSYNKTDRLDVRGLNRLQQAGVLPTVWIPPGELRDQRDLPRTRMYLVAIRTKLKNRIHSALAKYALKVADVRDIFGKQCRSRLLHEIGRLPVHSRLTTEEELSYVDSLDKSIVLLDDRISQTFDDTREVQLIRTIPGIGPVIGIVVWLEVGDINRFGSPGRLASYAGTVPRVHASGGRVRHGQLRPDVNNYLKWAYSEAANSIVINQHVYPDRHVTKLYRRIRHKRGHQKAIGAVARHMAEATYWILTKKEAYLDPALKQSLPTGV